MNKLTIRKTVVFTAFGLAVGGSAGFLGWVVDQEMQERKKPAVYTTLCVAGQNRVIESNKTREFHVMWDETCPK